MLYQEQNLNHAILNRLKMLSYYLELTGPASEFTVIMPQARQLSSVYIRG